MTMSKEVCNCCGKECEIDELLVCDRCGEYYCDDCDGLENPHICADCEFELED